MEQLRPSGCCRRHTLLVLTLSATQGCMSQSSHRSNTPRRLRKCEKMTFRHEEIIAAAIGVSHLTSTFEPRVRRRVGVHDDNILT